MAFTKDGSLVLQAFLRLLTLLTETAATVILVYVNSQFWRYSLISVYAGLLLGLLSDLAELIALWMAIRQDERRTSYKMMVAVDTIAILLLIAWLIPVWSSIWTAMPVYQGLFGLVFTVM